MVRIAAQSVILLYSCSILFKCKSTIFLICPSKPPKASLFRSGAAWAGSARSAGRLAHSAFWRAWSIRSKICRTNSSVLRIMRLCSGWRRSSRKSTERSTAASFCPQRQQPDGILRRMCERRNIMPRVRAAGTSKNRLASRDECWGGKFNISPFFCIFAQNNHSFPSFLAE